MFFIDELEDGCCEIIFKCFYFGNYFLIVRYFVYCCIFVDIYLDFILLFIYINVILNLKIFYKIF